ncbi:MAG: sulfite exporter TauE/SafE family protein [Anaerolineae bacterium]
MSTIVIMLFATFVQGAAGFGMALVSMPMLVYFLGIRTATPLVALIGIATEVVMLVYYREALTLQDIWRLSAASLVGIPLGVWLLRRLDADVVTAVLGVILIIYALYSLGGLHLPKLANRAWAFAFGFVGGLLSGAYNTSGPPAVVYADCRRWPPAQFKSNLQGYFLLNSLMAIAVHGLSGNLTTAVWHNFWLGLPTAVLGLALGVRLDNHINPARFRQMVLVLLVVLGVRLVL